MFKKVFLVTFLTVSLVTAFFVVTTGFMKPAGVIHVSPDVRISGPGYQWWPMVSLEEALAGVATRTRDDRAVFFSGEHTGTFFVPDGVRLKGSENAKIIGQLNISDSVTLTDFTITGDGPGLRIEGTGSVTGQRLIVEGNAGDGVDMMFHAEAHFVDSTFRDNRKGIYGRDYTTVTLTNSLIEENKQEGLDVRAFTTVDIGNNTMRNNGESGIEFILGGSRGQAVGNTIVDNAKSGIVLEFSRHAADLGSILLKNNTITDNGDTGVRCVSRSGGTRPHRYFKRSVERENNAVERNENKDFSTTCKFDAPIDPSKL